ncbi:hypothetical protein K0M31_010774 [Melipona bicolor]|uniref:Uncharacterized protein n=1 Tax=Melipona bicolor TaxID=60889 RepID=A0AA40KHX8_9HYME|nr:hypothetical protein K0M31_010774 [Melipona bicolor]
MHAHATRSLSANRDLNGIARRRGGHGQDGVQRRRSARRNCPKEARYARQLQLLRAAPPPPPPPPPPVPYLFRKSIPTCLSRSAVSRAQLSP